MENIEQLIQQAANKDYSAANTTFVDIMNQKLGDALEQEKIKVSGEIYNGLDDEEQLELDLEDDESEEDDVDVDDETDTDESDEDTEES